MEEKEEDGEEWSVERDTFLKDPSEENVIIQIKKAVIGKGNKSTFAR